MDIGVKHLMLSESGIVVCIFAAALYLLIATPFIYPYNRFKRVGKAWPMSWIPGAMLLSVDKYVELGYKTVIKPLDSPFVMAWWGLDYLFMPPKYLADLKSSDHGDMSFFQNISDAFSLHASVGDLYKSDIMIDVVKRKLNPQLPALVPILAKEMEYAFQMTLGDVQDWKAFNATAACGELMHRITSRILMGEELCRNENFVKASRTFGTSLFGNAVIFALMPLGLLRKPLAWIGSFVHRRNLEKTVKFVVPVIEQRLSERFDQKVSHTDAMQWNIELAEGNQKEYNSRRIALQLLQNLFAGSGAPGSMVTQIVFQCLMEPNYVEPLRQECEVAFSTYGLTEKALNNMPLMDSFIMEINRMYPAGCVTCARTILRDNFRFHDGFTLPAGTRIAFPILAIQQDSANFSDPLKFDGFRFTNLNRLEARKENEPQASAATVSKTNLAFGYGKHACVGRYYTIRKVKLIVSKLITEYEFKWTKDVLVRPASFSIMGQFAPNLEEMIYIRARAH